MTQQDADFARRVLAGQLQQIADHTAPQLSAAELSVKLAQDQLDKLDDLLEAWREAIDFARGESLNTQLSILDAIKALTAALVGEAPNAALPGAASGAAVVAGPAFGGIQSFDDGAGFVPYTGDPGYAYAGGVAPSQYWADKQGTWNDPRGNNWTGPIGGDTAVVDKLDAVVNKIGALHEFFDELSEGGVGLRTKVEA
jgi:hypothetical protein